MTSIEKLWRKNYLAASEFEDYAKRLRFAPSLLEAAASTLLMSIHYGDGMLWSDSLLVNSLLNSESCLRSLFDRFPGYRTSLIAETEFKATLSTKRLSVQPSFQTALSESLFADVRQHGGVMTEERVLEIELRDALESFIDRQEALATFASEVSRPILDLAEGCSNEDDRRKLIRAHYFLEDVIFLSLLAETHPFQSLSRPQESNSLDQSAAIQDTGDRSDKYLMISRRYKGSSFEKARRAFYWQLRDAANCANTLLSDEDLMRIAGVFSKSRFRETCIEMDSSDIYASLEDDDETVGDLRDHFHYAAARLYASHLPISLLADRLSGWRSHAVDSVWPLSQKILLSLGEFQFDASFLDVGEEVPIQTSVRPTTRMLADVGIWVPNPVWTDSLLERFAFMLGRGESEEAFQRLFEAYPEFILDELHVEAYPQVFLFQEKSRTILRPDFAVRRRDSSFVDFIEIKKPGSKLLTGTSSRPVLTRTAATAIAQLNEYRDWFRSTENRRWFRERNGLDGFEPRLTLVIGRRSPQMNPEVWSKATSGTDVRLVTYDDLADTAHARRLWLP